MSSILDALEKIESTQAPVRPSGRARRRSAWRLAASVVIALAVGIVGTIALLGRHPEVPPAPAHERAAPVAVARGVAPVPAPIAGEAERPWGTAVETATPPEPADAAAPVAAAPTTPATVAPAEAAPPPSPPKPAAIDVGPPTPPAPAPVAAVPAPGPPPTLAASAAEPVVAPAPVKTPPPAEVGTRIPSGLPRLRVSFLVYSTVPARRSVALTIDNGSLTTAHEGDDVNGIEILRIRADGVEMRWQGQSFLLPVRG